MKSDIRNLSHEELGAFVKDIGEASFRADQIFEWIYKKGAVSFDDMKNLPAALRQKLNERFELFAPAIVHEERSEDGTRKVLFDLKDHERVETVLIPAEKRATICVSTQAGCKFGCKFCASGIGGWSRDLSAAEILSQILYMRNSQKGQPLSHIVFMGVGEPLDNYDNLLKAIRTINAAKGINIGARRITISTCGLVPKIQRLAKEGMQIELAVSLHGSSNEARNVLMPVNRKYPVADLIAACREYNRATKRQITFEYILIKAVTCTPAAAAELGRLLKGLVCKVNLIPYNKVNEFDHETPSREEIFEFRDLLMKHGVHATVRMPRGRDVAAACGQLRHSSKK
jgi:23S rRNA (adenine2503-C2)-methyltransferase